MRSMFMDCCVIILPIQGWQGLCVIWDSLASWSHIILVSSHTGHCSPFQQEERQKLMGLGRVCPGQLPRAGALSSWAVSLTLRAVLGQHRVGGK